MECKHEAIAEASEIFKCMINWMSNVNYSHETVFKGMFTRAWAPIY